MGFYLLFFGLFVLVLFLTGIFYTISEFKEMSEDPSRYTKSDDKLKVEE